MSSEEIEICMVGFPGLARFARSATPPQTASIAQISATLRLLMVRFWVVVLDDEGRTNDKTSASLGNGISVCVKRAPNAVLVAGDAKGASGKLLAAGGETARLTMGNLEDAVSTAIRNTLSLVVRGKYTPIRSARRRRVQTPPGSSGR